MLALYRRRQLEWALWRLSTGTPLHHTTPYEFSTRVAELLREGIGQPGEKATATASIYSPLDALLVWIGLEFSSCGLTAGEAAALARRLRWDLAEALNAKPSAGTRGETVLLFTRGAHNPYAGPMGEGGVLKVLALNELHEAAAKASAIRGMMVLPIERAAAALANFLSDAPATGRSRR